MEKDLVVVAPHHFGGEMLSIGNLNAPENDANTKISRIVKPLKAAIDDLQRNLIQDGLTNSSGNWTAAAKELGVNRSNLHKLAKRLKIK
jgi:transcriptional regulator with GAF, ATPase, and Fis domain